MRSLEPKLRESAAKIVAQESLHSYELDTETDGDNVVKYIITFAHGPKRPIDSDELDTFKFCLEVDLCEHVSLPRKSLEVRSTEITD